MNSPRYLLLLVLSVPLALAGCGGDGGGFSGANNQPGAGAGGSGGFSGSGGGSGAGGNGGAGGAGGGGTGAAMPDLAHQVQAGAAIADIKMSGDGRFVVYRSDEQLPNSTDNPGGVMQIFLTERGPDMPVQVTRASSSNAIADGVFDVTNDGREILFSSTQDLVGQNSTMSQNLFVVRNSGQTVAQVTSNLSVDGFSEWQIAGDGSYAVFSTNRNFMGTNPDQDIELYRINIDGTSPFQITSDMADPSDIRLADDSDRIAYLSDGNPLGTNADLNPELFVINSDGSDHRQLTDTVGAALDIVGLEISDSGERIVLASNRDLVPGGNVDTTYEVFVVDADSGAITQVTNTDRDSGVFAGNIPGDVDISGNGQYVVFGSTFDFVTGANASNQHTIFWASADGARIGQPLREGTVLSSATSFAAENVGLSDDGDTIIFDSLENYSADAFGPDRKIYSQARQ